MTNQSELSDFVSRLNVARSTYSVSVIVKHTFTNIRVLMLLEDVGVIRGFYIPNMNDVEVFLKYQSLGVCTFTKISIISTPGKRVHVTFSKLHILKSKLGYNTFYILSTKNGIVLDSECLYYGFGGELLLSVQL